MTKPNGCDWEHPETDGECHFNGTSWWRYQVARAIGAYEKTGRKMYVRGYRKWISHPGAWSYGAYNEPWPQIDRNWSKEYGCRWCVAEYYDGAPGTPYWVFDPSCPLHGDPEVLGFEPDTSHMVSGDVCATCDCGRPASQCPTHPCHVVS